MSKKSSKSKKGGPRKPRSTVIDFPFGANAPPPRKGGRRKPAGGGS